MNNPYCYSIITDCGETHYIKPTLKEIISLAIEILDSAYYYSDKKWSPVEAHFLDGSKKDVDLRLFIEFNQLTNDDLLKIEQDIDSEIEKTETYLKTIKGTVTGYFGITKDRREWAINNEIKARSHKWKDLESINWDELRNIYL